MRMSIPSACITWLSSCILLTAASNSPSENSAPTFRSLMKVLICSMPNVCACSLLYISSSETLNVFNLQRDYIYIYIYKSIGKQNTVTKIKQLQGVINDPKNRLFSYLSGVIVTSVSMAVSFSASS